MPTRVYVGDLGDRGSRTDLEREFSRFGRVNEVWVARNPPGFAFVFMESYSEAEDAVHALDGAKLCGLRVRVEIARGPEKGSKAREGPKCYECGRVGHATRDCTRRPGYIFRGRNSEFARRIPRKHWSRSRSREKHHDHSSRKRRNRSLSNSRRYNEKRRSKDRQRSRSRSFRRDR